MTTQNTNQNFTNHYPVRLSCCGQPTSHSTPGGSKLGVSGAPRSHRNPRTRPSPEPPDPRCRSYRSSPWKPSWASWTFAIGCCGRNWPGWAGCCNNTCCGEKNKKKKHNCLNTDFKLRKKQRLAKTFLMIKWKKFSIKNQWPYFY